MNTFLFIEQLETDASSWLIQFQFSGITVNLQATSLSFLNDMSKFIHETTDNPAYRDREVASGIYRTMQEKSCTLSNCFDIPVTIVKDGEYDDSYVMRVELSSGNWVHIDIRGKNLIELIAELDTAIDEWL